jgi:hypothetical protein
MPEGLYLFCLTLAGPIAPLRGKGLDGEQPLQLRKFRDIAAIWCPVALEDFCGDEAAARMADLSWLGARACRHEEVVEELMRVSPVLPARFGAIFSSPEKLGRLLEQHYDAISRFLERVRGCGEWALKGFLDRAWAREEFFSLSLAREADRLEPLPPGKRYFEVQRLKAASAKELNGWLREVGASLKAQLQESGLEVCERRLPPRGTRGGDPEMVLNWAVLLPHSRVTDFRDWVGAANALYQSFALTLKYTGPRPPYSFSPSLSLEAGA